MWNFSRGTSFIIYLICMLRRNRSYVETCMTCDGLSSLPVLRKEWFANPSPYVSPYVCGHHLPSEPGRLLDSGGHQNPQCFLAKTRLRTVLSSLALFHIAPSITCKAQSRGWPIQGQRLATILPIYLRTSVSTIPVPVLPLSNAAAKPLPSPLAALPKPAIARP